ncbi:Otefin [Eumeta japonica]|uniref:Otefin n=1 Tax=Eumeta variegata TaxID=151549 RepID=A0A4C1XV84_EUMVA|nr:Otefin [Eumeta japonica]
MADRVRLDDSMSDAELQAKLAEHGFPVMPITPSARKFLVKRLKVIIQNKTKRRNSIANKADSHVQMYLCNLIVRGWSFAGDASEPRERRNVSGHRR